MYRADASASAVHHQLPKPSADATKAIAAAPAIRARRARLRSIAAPGATCACPALALTIATKPTARNSAKGRSGA